MRLFKALFFVAFSALSLSADATVFVYHRFNDTKHASTSVSNEKLRADFQYLKDNGYRVVPLNEVVKLLKSGQPVPDKTVALTIDDNYHSFYTNGLPIFKEFGYPFTLYVYVKATESRYGAYMDWDAIKDASRFGEIGLHSYAHPHLPYESDRSISEDTAKSYRIFTERMGYAPKSYAYPYGEFDQRVQTLIKAQGFDFICNQNAGAVSDFSDPYSIERIAVTDDTSISQKLRTRALHVKKIRPKVEKNCLKGAEIVLGDPSLKSVEIYLSGYGWERVKVNNAKVSYNTDKILRFDRNRLIIKHGNKIASQLIMKRK